MWSIFCEAPLSLMSSIPMTNGNTNGEKRKNKRSVTRQVKLFRTKGAGWRVLGRNGEWRDAGGTHHEDVGAISHEHLVKVETIAIDNKEQRDLAADVLLVEDCAGSRQRLEEDPEREGSASAIVNRNLRILWVLTLLFLFISQK